MTRESLADRIILYSDTIVAFGLVNGLAFFVSLADPDIRCSIAGVAGVTLVANTLVPIVSTWAIFWLRGYEVRLRGEAGLEEEAPLVAGFRRRLFTIRLVLIWVFGLVVLLGIYGSTRDPGCQALFQG